MRTILLCLIAFATGCATSQPTAPTALTTSKVASPRNDCPRGYAMVANSAGAACWPADKETPPKGCKPFRCPDTGYMLWDCPEPAAIVPPSAAQPAGEEHWIHSRVVEPLQWMMMYLVNSEGSFRCECATNAARKTVCRDCKPKQPGEATDPELQAQLERTVAEYQCLLRMGSSHFRKTPFANAPGRVLRHEKPDGQPYAEYHYYRSEGDQHFVCPIKPKATCNPSTMPGDQMDEACVLYAECLEACLDAGGHVIW